MRKIFLTSAASAAVLLGLMAIPAGAGASVHRHALPSKYAFLAHAKHGNFNALPAKQKRRLRAEANRIRKVSRSKARASQEYYIGSTYGYMDVGYWEDDYYQDDYGDIYGYFGTGPDYYYGDADYACTYWIYDSYYGETFGLFDYCS